MNYIQTFRDSFHLFRTNKLIWIFGFLSLLITFPFGLFSFIPNNSIFSFAYLPIIFAGLVLTSISSGSLYYVIYQASLLNRVSFSEAWQAGNSKMLQSLGIIFTCVPLLFIGEIIAKIIVIKSLSSIVLWLFVFLENTLVSAFLAFGLSAIIDSVKVLPAALASFRIIIYGHNFYRVLAITGLTFLIRLLVTGLVVAILATGVFGVILPTPLTLDYPTYQKITAIPIVAGVNWIFNLVLFPLGTIMLIFVYLKFANEISYSASAQRQNTA